MPGGEKGRNHATKAEDDARHEDIARLWVKDYSPSDILQALQQQHPNLTIDIVYEHIEELKKQASDYLVLRYLPKVGEYFYKAHQNLQDVRSEAWNLFYNGVERTEITTFPDSKVMKKLTKLNRNPQMLALIASLSIAEVSITDMAPSIKKVQAIIDENRYLKDGQQEAKALPSAKVSKH